MLPMESSTITHYLVDKNSNVDNCSMRMLA